MRTVLVTFFVLLLGVTQAQNTAFEKAILKGKQQIHAANTPEGYREAANYFERVALKEPKEWLPRYYQAQCLAIIGSSQQDPDQKETILNEALLHIQKAKELDRNAEVMALEGFIQMIRLTVDPANRGQTLSPRIFGLYQEALELDPQNPRALLFMGQMAYGTAQFFGSGFEDACGFIQKAYDIFDQQEEAATIYPTWGFGSAKASLEGCNQ